MHTTKPHLHPDFSQEGAKCQTDQCETMKGEDQVTEIIGQVGPFQLFWWATLSFSTILHSLAMMSNKFQLYPVDFWCARPDSFSNSTLNDWLRVSGQSNEDGNIVDGCHIFDLPYSMDLVSKSHYDVVEKQSKTTCTKWEYDTSQFQVKRQYCSVVYVLHIVIQYIHTY